MTAPPPLSSTVFVDGELVTEAKLYARIWVVINYLLALVNSTTGLARFFGTTTTATAYTTGSNLAFGTVVEDTGSGYSAGVYTCQSTGTYQFNAQLKTGAGAAAPQPILMKNGVAYIQSPTPPSAANSGQAISGYLRLVVGDTVALRTAANFTSSSLDAPAHNNYLQLVQMTFT